VDGKKSHYQLIPEKELKCVWMAAGLLSYKLCKYNLQCEKCPLDWELRNQPAKPSFHPMPSEEKRNTSPHEAGSPPLWKKGTQGEELSLFNIKGSLFYHPGHTWIEVEKADEVRVGLDHFLGRTIGRVKVVVLPLSGKRCFQGENLCCLIQDEGILHIVFPISGSILSVNQKLKDQPELVTKDPLGEGFLLTLRPKNLQRDQKRLFSGETSLSWYQKELERFKTAVISELYGQERVGLTMQDGGMKLGDIKALVGPERYIRLLSTFLRNGEKDLSRSKYKRRDYSKFQLGQ